MKQIYPVLVLLIITSCVQKKEKIMYPETKKQDVTDVYFGTKVSDPYRWLEDDNSEETKAWVEAQNKLTQSYLEKLPEREVVKERLQQLWDYPKVTAPFKKGELFFDYKNTGLQNQSVLFVKKSPEDEGEVLLDPNTLSEDGTVALNVLSVKSDGKLVAYSISRGGSDWNEIFVRDIETRKDLTDHIKWVKFSGISWYKDGFFYGRYPEPKSGDALKGENKNSQIYYHKIGDPQEKDALVYEDKDHPGWGFNAQVTNDESYLLISVTESTSGNALYIKDLKSGGEVRSIVDGFENDYAFMDYVDGSLLFLTNKDASNYKLVSLDPRKKSVVMKDVIPESEGVLEDVTCVGGKLIAEYMKDARSLVKVFSKEGNYLYDIDLPLLGTAEGFLGEESDGFTFFSMTSFTTPGNIYKYDVASNKTSVFSRAEIDFDSDLYETKQIFYQSKDGTSVPMFITHKKGLSLDGNNPTLLYGYGGFNISLKPSFSVTRLIWLENNGVLAIPNLRGGGEYGEEWHKAGTLMQKQNVFDDFISAAEYLIGEGYTNSDKLAIQGGSNGGLLVGACVNQRPDLFAVAFPAVGVMDMLRYHKFTIGRYWATDYGTSEQSKEMFDYLLAYSPLHTVKEGADYPAIMVTTADHDDRVVPLHSFKYAAELQARVSDANPALIRIATNAGHGAGKPTAMVIQEYADLWAFAFDKFGLSFKRDL